MDAFERIKQTSLVQWGAAYAAAAWVVLQLVDVVGGQFGWSPSVGRGVVAVLIVGLFLTLVLAWFHGERGRQRVSAPELLIIAGILGVGAMLLPILTGESRSLEAGGEVGALGDLEAKSDPRPSVAVLPFANRSTSEEDLTFTDGIHDQVLTRLTRIAGLKVISRTSVMEYREAPKNLRAIGIDLGVRYVLEGTVQRAGLRVRVATTLIDAQTDEHLWTDEFVRPFELDSLFDLQAHIADQVAGALQTSVTEAERRLVYDRPTDNPEAFELFVRAETYLEGGVTPENYRNAGMLVESALEADPNFLEAHLLMVSISVVPIHFGLDRSREGLSRATQALAKAESLAPGDPRVALLRGQYLYQGLRDYDGAVVAYAEAASGLPNAAAARLWMAFVQRRTGDWDGALSSLLRARELDPRNTDILGSLGETLVLMHRYTAAREPLELARKLDPGPFAKYTFLSQHYLGLGDVGAARQVLEVPGVLAPDLTEARLEVFRLSRDWTALGRLAGSWPSDILTTQRAATSRWFVEGLQARFAGSEERALVLFDSASAWSRDALVAEPEDALLWDAHAKALSMAGRHDRAVDAAKRATMLLPISTEAVVGTHLEYTLAIVLGRAGRSREAVDILARLVDQPSSVTPAHILFDPLLDPLRETQQFRGLVAEANQLVAENPRD